MTQHDKKCSFKAKDYKRFRQNSFSLSKQLRPKVTGVRIRRKRSPVALQILILFLTKSLFRNSIPHISDQGQRSQESASGERGPLIQWHQRGPGGPSHTSTSTLTLDQKTPLLFDHCAYQGGRTWQPFVGSKNGNEKFRQARINNFCVQCVVFCKINSVKYAIYTM